MKSILNSTMALVVGGGLALGAVLGFTVFADDEFEYEVVAAPTAVSALDCPEGATLTEVFGGDRVYAIGQDESGAWRAIRNPRDTRQLVWVPAASLEQDAEIDLPVLDCALEGTVTVIEAAPAEDTTTTTEAPEETTTTTSSTTTTSTTSTTTTTTQPGDTEPPQWGGIPYIERFVIYGAEHSAACVIDSDLLYGVSDNVGVTSVTGTYGGGLPGSPLVFQDQGNGTWAATFGPFFGLGDGYDQEVGITITARDAAGNSASLPPLPIRVIGATCLR